MENRTSWVAKDILLAHVSLLKSRAMESDF